MDLHEYVTANVTSNDRRVVHARPDGGGALPRFKDDPDSERPHLKSAGPLAACSYCLSAYAGPSASKD